MGTRCRTDTSDVPIGGPCSEPTLTVFSNGGGQDSSAILHLLLADRAFRARYAPEHLVVVMSDTGDEHPQTLVHVAAMKRLTDAAGIPFFILTPDMGFHSASWRTLTHFYRTHTTIGSKAYPKTCTDRLKIQPIYRWLERYVGERFGCHGRRKRGLYQFCESFGRIRMLIGISAEEAKRRVSDGHRDPVWMRNCIEKVYPLVERGMTRADCVAYLRSIGESVPMPSSCMRCHFSSEKDLLWLANEHPEKYAEWVELEAAKLAKHRDRGSKNLGVFGTRTLPVTLQRARAKHGSMTREELWQNKFSHGHCVRSSY